jgi:hypothetical protein
MIKCFIMNMDNVCCIRKCAIQSLLIITVLITACSNNELDEATPQIGKRGLNKVTALDAINQAEAIRLQADDLGFEWATIEPLLVNARKSFESGDFENATALANEAKKHAEQAVIQAHYEHQHWKERVPSIQDP